MNAEIYIPSGLPGKRKSKPPWWDPECERELEKRRTARRELMSCQTNEILCRYRVSDNEVKKFFRDKKKNAYVEFCDSIKPSMGLKEIWDKVTAFATSSQPLKTGTCNDTNYPVFRRFRDALAQTHFHYLIFHSWTFLWNGLILIVLFRKLNFGMLFLYVKRT